MAEQRVVINYIPRVTEQINELFVNREGEDLLGDHLRNLLYNGTQEARDHVLDQFSGRVDHHKISLFRGMLSDESLFLGAGLDDPRIVQKLAGRFIVGGRRYSEILAEKNVDITAENCKYAVTDMAILSDMALSFNEDAPVVGFLSEGDQPIKLIPNTLQFRKPVLTRDDPPQKPNWFKRVLNKLFNAFSDEIGEYNSYKNEYEVAEHEYFELVNRANAHINRCRDEGVTFAGNIAQVQNAAPTAAVEMNAAQLNAEEAVERGNEAPAVQHTAPTAQHTAPARERADGGMGMGGN